LESGSNNIIDRWLELERRLDFGSPDGSFLTGIGHEIEQLRRDYQQVTAVAIAARHALRRPGVRQAWLNHDRLPDPWRIELPESR
jgi:hypothetical protein